MKQDRGHDRTIVAIGAFKLLKSLCLLVLGAALVRWRDKDFGVLASQWIDKLWLSRSYFEGLISRLSFTDKKTVDQVAIGSFLYAALLATEGVGLCLRKRWAEYLTIGITSSLLPLEFYELYSEITATRVAITLVNMAIVVYLIVRVARRR
jgi:uncharacterized membrane protein (DUF2068 family)